MGEVIRVGLGLLLLSVSSTPVAAQDASVASIADAGVPPAVDASVVASDGGLSEEVEEPPQEPVAEDAGIVADAGVAAPPEPPAEPTTEPRTPEPEPRSDATAPTAPHSPVVFVPTPLVQDESALDALLPALPWGKWTAGRLLLLLLAVMLLSFLAQRAREKLPVAGAVPRLVRAAHITLQLSTVFVAAAVLARVLSPSLGPALPWMLVVASAAVAWSARDVMPDLVAALVLTFEQRIRAGMWVSGEGFTGIVERRGLRAVWLRDGRGNRIAVPNRRLLDTPVVSQLTEGSYHEVTVRLTSTEPARVVRQSLRDAVLTSPWVHPDIECVIRRDGRDPELWHVRAQLLDIRFSLAFDGDLIERAEDILDALARDRRAAAADDWD